MGEYIMWIEGCGPHHNPDCDEDADKLLRRFVGELQEAGHRELAGRIVIIGQQDAFLGAGSGNVDHLVKPPAVEAEDPTAKLAEPGVSLHFSRLREIVAEMRELGHADAADLLVDRSGLAEGEAT